MKKIKLTLGQYTKVDDDLYNYLMQWKWRASCNGRSDDYYALRCTTRDEKVFRYRRTVAMHRVVLAYRKFGCNFTEEQYDSMDFCDHMFHDTLDNRSSKLRECTNRENTCNRKTPGFSAYPGVTYRRTTNKYMVQVSPCKRQIRVHIGYFICEDKAGQVAVDAREYVVTNNIADAELIKQWAQDHGYRK